DPRDPTVDPVDWIEMIPYGETRNYVQRVLENIQLYRNRLSGNEQKLTILSDLYRPKLPSVIVVKYQPPAPEDVPIPVPKPTQASVCKQAQRASHSRAWRCASAICPALISAEICARHLRASFKPFIAAKLNHLCAAM